MPLTPSIVETLCYVRGTLFFFFFWYSTPFIENILCTKKEHVLVSIVL